MCRFIEYRRVSTDRQEASGLGLDAQREAIARYVASQGGEIVGEFVETESRRMRKRPQLTRAIALAKRTKSVIVVGKLDRLIGDYGLLVQLRDAKIQFIAADDPNASELTVDLRVLISVDEVRKIRARTREALARAKARGVVLGTPKNLSDAGRHAGGEMMKALAMDRDARSLKLLKELVKQGKSLRTIASELTTDEDTWNPMRVKRAIKRFDLATS